MANELFNKIPDWLKSLWHVETEIRKAAQHGLFMRKAEAAQHLSEARRHLDDAIGAAKSDEGTGAPTPPRKEGDV